MDQQDIVFLINLLRKSLYRYLLKKKDLAIINDYVKEYFEGKDTSNVINEFVFRIFKLTKEEINYIASENYLYNQ